MEDFFDAELLGLVLELDIPLVNTTDSLLALNGALSRCESSICRDEPVE